jgi:aminopeptidase
MSIESSSPCAPISEAAVAIAARHVHDILTLAIEYASPQQAIVVGDSQSALAATLNEAYRRCLPGAIFIDFDAVSPAFILAEFARLAASDLVVLIQSTSFRLEAFRIRVELFKRGLKVIEHPHLIRMSAGAEELCYIDSLAYDPVYTRGTGHALKACIDRASHSVIDSGGAQLVFSCGLETAKLNVGDYREMANVGGQFPIGEVFTEARDLEAVSGRIRISHFGDTTFSVNTPAKPITLIVSEGRVSGTENSTAEFDEVLTNIRADDGEVWVRELGFGLNRAFSQERTVTDIGTFERMCGIHLSLGSKHASYNKPQISRSKARHHVDVFALTNTVTLDDQVVYRDGAWQV